MILQHQINTYLLIIYLDYHIPLIFRSASEDISASGIFNSIVSKNNYLKLDLNQQQPRPEDGVSNETKHRQ